MGNYSILKSKVFLKDTEKPACFGRALCPPTRAILIKNYLFAQRVLLFVTLHTIEKLTICFG